MAIILNNVFEYYKYIFHDLSDERTRDTNIILNPIWMTLAMVLYYKIVTQWGPALMRNREPFKIERILILYNAFQIVASAYIAFTSIRVVWWSRYYSFSCQPISRETTPIEMIILRYVKYYYWMKIVDLLDTIFFVMRKKTKQVSFLHVYHHIIMVFGGFMTLKYLPGGHASLVGTINCIVHAAMYSYYLLTALRPNNTRIWWKKYLTQMQLLQFIILFIHFFQLLFRPSCTYPKWATLLFLPQNAFMIFMFSDFYYKEYIRKKKIN